MPRHSALLLALFLPLLASAGDDLGPTATAQHLFDAMSAHDVNAARALFIPEATLVSVRADGKPTVVPIEKWLEHLGTSKDAWLERMWNAKVLESSGLAVVWADYDFHLNGKFSHCGIDSFNLVKLDAQWKISGVSYTAQTAGCSPSPLGPPSK
jgi:hypothetical protein